MAEPMGAGGEGLPEGLFARLVELRRDLHRHPELSFQEQRSGERVARDLEALGLKPVRGVAGTGVVVDVGAGPGRPDGPTVALRADLDALPIEEATGLPFSSEHGGVMHACGHDAHTAMLMGAVALLHADPPPGRVRAVFQPAEEKGNGALVVCNEGWMEGVHAVFGIHVDPRWTPGHVILSAGPVNASSRYFKVAITGRGGHAARPQDGVDAAWVAASILQALQGIVSRETDPSLARVVTVGRLEAGTRHNVLAASAVMEGTIRCFDRALEHQMRDGVVRIAQGVAAAHRATVEVEFGEGCPAVVNEPRMTEVARLAAVGLLGEAKVHPQPAPHTGAEDFSFFLDRAPGCYARIGCGFGQKEVIPTHHPGFDLDERAIAVGARYLEAVARRAIGELGGTES
jgi:hippurate hydrolase